MDIEAMQLVKPAVSTEENLSFLRVCRSNIFYRNKISSFVVPEQVACTLSMEIRKRLQDTFAALSKGEFAAADWIAGTAFGLPLAEETAFKALLAMMLSYAKPNPESRGQELLSFESACLNHAPDIAAYWHSFATLRLRLGEIDKAVSMFKRALEVDSTFAPSYAALALLYTLEQQWEEAERYARAALIRNGECGPRLMALCLMASTHALGKPVEGGIKTDTLNAPVWNLNEVFRYLPPFDHMPMDHNVHGKPIVFISCDATYFKDHAVALVLSLAKTSPGVIPHLHVMNPNTYVTTVIENLKAKLAPITIGYSFEQVPMEHYGVDKVYYSCVRFCRLYQMVKINAAPIIMVDADTLARKNIITLPGLFDPAVAIGLSTNPDAPFWERYSAGLTLFKRSEYALRFLAQVSRFVTYNIKERVYRWFLDQAALSFVVEAEKDKAPIMTLDAAACCDTFHGEQALFWAITHDQQTEGSAYEAYRQELNNA